MSTKTISVVQIIEVIITPLLIAPPPILFYISYFLLALNSADYSKIAGLKIQAGATA